jgi:hypothetical protein
MPSVPSLRRNEDIEPDTPISRGEQVEPRWHAGQLVILGATWDATIEVGPHRRFLRRWQSAEHIRPQELLHVRTAFCC